MCDPFSMICGVAGLLSTVHIVVERGWAVWQFIKTVDDFKIETYNLLMEVNGLYGVLLALATVVDRLPGSERAGQRVATKGLQIASCQQVLGKLLDALQKFSPENNKFKTLGKAIVWPLKKQETVDMMHSIERYKTTFTLAISADTMSKVIDIFDGVKISNRQLLDVRTEQKRVAEERSEKDQRIKREKSLHWLFPGDPEEKHRDIRKKKHSDTGVWLLDTKEFKSWFQTPGSWLFCYGKAGAGKTVLTSSVIDYISSKFRGEDVGIAHIYFDFKNQEDQTPTRVLSSILRQLGYRKSSLPTEIESLYINWSKNGKTPDVRELEDAIISVANSFSRVWLFLDALDECDKTDQRDELLSFIRRITKAETCISGFATSRGYAEDIRSTFINITQMEISACKTDIEAFVRWKISTRIEDQKLIQEMVSEISRKADGMFLLVEFQVNHILEQTNGRKMLQALKTIPKNLHGRYREAIDRIHCLGEDRRKLALDALAWVFHAARPLRPRELREALAVEETDTKIEEYYLTDENTLTDLCKGLIGIDQNSQTVRFVHHTVQEFFAKNPDILQGAHAVITKTCLTYLSFESFGQIPVGQISIHSLARRLEKNTFYEYAARNWAYHARFCQEEISVRESVLKFSNSGQRMQSALHLFFTEPWRISKASQNKSVYFNDSRSTLTITAELGLVSLAKFLIEQNTMDLNQRDTNDDHTPLSRAAFRGQAEMVRLLVGFDFVEVDLKDKSGSTPLSIAAFEGHSEVVQILLERSDVSVDWKDNRGRTPLNLAASMGHAAVVQLLLQRDDVDVHSVDKYGRTPLKMAANEGNVGVVNLLLGSMEETFMETTGKLILSQAASSGDLGIVRLLVEMYHLAADTKDELGNTPLSKAASEGHDDVVRFLVERDDVEIDSKNNDGSTPLLVAALGGHAEVVQVLLETGADCNSKDYRGRTPLNRAVLKGHLAVVELLLQQNDIDADLGDKCGRTPLRWAAYLGYPQIVQLLIKRNDVDIHSKGNDGKTALDLCLSPLDWVEKNAVEEVVLLLRRKIARRRGIV